MLANRIFSLVLIAFLGFSVSGCGAVILGSAVAGGTYVYVAGQAQQKYNADLGKVYKATLKACQDLKLKIDDGKKRLSDASVKATDVDVAIYINLTSVSSKITEVSVRYGILGDEQAASRILSAIAKNL
ncbi:DUF3568 domain-containing protein [Maridesulfovibrio hydrothermalis]|uniref:DUF3568 family protein n=1 Tax=Maridesulfovibrio hydrothermalis AM13 = DSM 14728 TaxID=1121451 RepID=L0RDX8_9BACT|nr:DUF3568 domain-containing protein [Maridesulfovibrio hydrothermalis]CCO24944.1 conserved exported protein of unknown function [Maridesulfovibrio hydrothermalis AM13 = DSM 14728]